MTSPKIKNQCPTRQKRFSTFLERPVEDLPDKYAMRDPAIFMAGQIDHARKHTRKTNIKKDQQP